MGDFDWTIILLAVVPVLFALTVQAVAQVLAARHYGDNTAVQMGRLTLNPVPHIDLIGTIMLPLFSVWMFATTGLPLIIGWVKPVPINYGNMRNIRMGLRMVAGLSEATVLRLLEARGQAPFDDTEDLALRACIATPEVNALAAADALLPLAGHRRQQVWQAAAIKSAPQLLKAVPTLESGLELAETLAAEIGRRVVLALGIGEGDGRQGFGAFAQAGQAVR